jgi:hypothetical protein
MSISEETISYTDVASFDDDESIPSQHYDNDRADRYSEETSSYHASVRADPLAKNKKHVKRMNPETGESTRVTFFPTLMIPGAAIKNAISGTLQSSSQGAHYFRVGTSDEDLFFSVILATGELGQEPMSLFYDNPEQYERHFFTKLSTEIKNAWLDKRDAALNRLKIQQKRSNDGATIVK